MSIQSGDQDQKRKTYVWCLENKQHDDKETSNGEGNFNCPGFCFV